LLIFVKLRVEFLPAPCVIVQEGVNEACPIIPIHGQA
jgi:hypothetical protein